MTRDEVVKSLGTPRSSCAQNNDQTLIYQFTDKPFGDGMIFPGTYYIYLKEGRLVAWNRDEIKDALDRERAFRLNAMALTPPPPPQRVQVQHSGFVNQSVNVSGNINTNPYIISPNP
jgi:hypothetical protein